MELIIGTRPMGRGVTHLEYVGDDEKSMFPSEGYRNALASPGTGRVMKFGWAACAAVLIFGGKQHRTKAVIAAGAIAALPFMTA